MLEAEKEEKVARHNLRRERHTEPINLYARKTLIEKLEKYTTLDSTAHIIIIIIVFSF
jgi:hypothetical protein